MNQIDSDDGPFIDMRPETVVCPAHGEHLRSQWPTGFLTVGLALFTAAAANDALIRAVDPAWRGDDGKANLNIDRLNRILISRPLCYWVDRDTIRTALMDAAIGSIGRCRVCNRSGIGGPYQVSMPAGTQDSWLCFECALDAGERLHRAHPKGKVWPSA